MASHKKRQIIAGALMTTVMAFTLSGFFSLLNLGFTPQWPSVWLRNFILGWPVGFVVSALVATRVQKLAARLAGEAQPSPSGR